MGLLHLHDTAHAMYQPKQRAKPTAPRIGKENVRSDLPPIGDRAGREAWMRAKQDKKRMQRRRV